MASLEPGRTRRYIQYTLVILGLVLVVLCVFLVFQYRALRRSQIISARELSLSNLLHHHGAVTANDVSFLRPWMTFDYINKLFGLPPDYLQTQLHISDLHYPGISLSGYARSYNSNLTVFMDSVQNAVRAYFTNQK